jgi:hypothetical protein
MGRASLRSYPARDSSHRERLRPGPRFALRSAAGMIRRHLLRRYASLEIWRELRIRALFHCVNFQKGSSSLYRHAREWIRLDKAADVANSGRQADPWCVISVCFATLGQGLRAKPVTWLVARLFEKETHQGEQLTGRYPHGEPACEGLIETALVEADHFFSLQPFPITLPCSNSSTKPRRNYRHGCCN